MVETSLKNGKLKIFKYEHLDSYEFDFEFKGPVAV